MMKSVIVSTILSLTCMFWSARAEAVPHISDYTLNLTREELLLRPVEEKDGKFFGQVMFGSQVWNGLFELRDERLYRISLMAPAGSSYMEAALQGFEHSPYVLYFVLTTEAHFDFTTHQREGLSEASINQAFMEYLQTAAAAGCTFISFFYTDPANYAKMSGQSFPPGTTGESIACNLTLSPDGINILIMNHNDLQGELNRRISSFTQTP